MNRHYLAIGVMLIAGTAAAECTKHDVELQVLGSGGPEYDDGRVSSSYLVWLDGAARVLVDAGPGSSVAFGASGARFEDLHAILLSHLHVDHAGDLPALIKGAYFSKRDRGMPII